MPKPRSELAQQGNDVNVSVKNVRHPDNSLAAIGDYEFRDFDRVASG